MPSDRRPGLDHAHFDWRPMPGRPPLSWPSGAPVAVCPVIAVEFFEEPRPAGAVIPSDLAGGLGLRASPNYPMLTHREYGHRVGIFRMLDVLEQHGVPPTVAIDAMTAEQYPSLVAHLSERGCSFIAHGLAVTRPITSRMSEAEEKDYIAQTLERLRAAGVATRGWLGPEYSESARTPRLLAEAGVEFVCDWLNDEQPYDTAYDGLVALPLWCDYDDSYALSKRLLTLDSYRSLLIRGFDELRSAGAASARVMAFQVRPWLTGQPHRVWVLDELLAHMRGDGGAWFATADEVVDAYRSR